MNEQTFYLLKIWLENAPESCHPYDMERFYQFVYALLEHDDGILNFDDFLGLLKKSILNGRRNTSRNFLTFGKVKSMQ